MRPASAIIASFLALTFIGLSGASARDSSKSETRTIPFNDYPGKIEFTRWDPPGYQPGGSDQCREGYVDVEYTVKHNGRASNIKVIKSEPGRYFVKRTLRSSKRWLFTRPKIGDEPVNVSGKKSRVKFEVKEEDCEWMIGRGLPIGSRF